METNLICVSFFCVQHFKSLRLDSEMEIELLFGKMGKQNRKRHYYPTAWDVCHRGIFDGIKRGSQSLTFSCCPTHSFIPVSTNLYEWCVYSCSVLVSSRTTRNRCWQRLTLSQSTPRTCLMSSTNHGSRWWPTPAHTSPASAELTNRSWSGI